MNKKAREEILTTIDKAAELYHRLVLVVGPASSGKTSALERLAGDLGVEVINLNLELSRRLLELTDRQRRLELPAVLDEIVEEAGPVVLLDNTELLFDTSLQHDPLRSLQELSRNRTVVASWSGDLQNGYLTYAAPDHPEYRWYPAGELVTVRPSEALE